MPQSEPELEQILIDRLTGLGYEPVKISKAKVRCSPCRVPQGAATYPLSQVTCP